MSKKLFMCTLLVFMIAAVSSAAELSLSDVNNFLNTSAKLGEGTKANQVAVIPFNHIDGPKEEDLFYAFVPFKYVARNYVKYQDFNTQISDIPPLVKSWRGIFGALMSYCDGRSVYDVLLQPHRNSYLAGFWHGRYFFSCLVKKLCNSIIF